MTGQLMPQMAITNTSNIQAVRREGGELSAAMGALKLDHVRAAQPDVFVSADMSCLMHLGGLAAKEGKPIKTLHLAQVLREALRHRT